MTDDNLRKPRPLDRKLARTSSRYVSDLVHLSFNGPSMRLYYVHEHVRRAVPQLLRAQATLARRNRDLQSALLDVQDALVVVSLLVDRPSPLDERAAGKSGSGTSGAALATGPSSSVQPTASGGGSNDSNDGESERTVLGDLADIVARLKGLEELHNRVYVQRSVRVATPVLQHAQRPKASAAASEVLDASATTVLSPS